MPLPKFQRIRPGTNAAQLLARVEDNMAAYASALTDERVGLLAHGLTVRQHSKGRVFTLTDVVVPDDWREITAAEMLNGWQLYASNASPVPANRIRIRKEAGSVEVRGVTLPPTPTTIGTAVFAWPTGYAPTGEEIFICQAEGQWAQVRALSGGLYVTARQGVVGQPQGWVSFSGVRFPAADRSPLSWPSASQLLVPLGEDFPGLPEVVRVEDAVTEAGVHLGPCAVEWERTTAGNVPAIRIRRVDRLAPVTTYTLILAVLAA